ncbi:hypothetical protein B0H19DRAFT_1123343 [Mycena capillaripes]|nr:hypothetical protein B0H19DRAFT_1123343 [Mycena capillaripes]
MSTSRRVLSTSTAALAVVHDHRVDTPPSSGGATALRIHACGILPSIALLTYTGCSAGISFLVGVAHVQNADILQRPAPSAHTQSTHAERHAPPFHEVGALRLGGRVAPSATAGARTRRLRSRPSFRCAPSQPHPCRVSTGARIVCSSQHTSQPSHRPRPSHPADPGWIHELSAHPRPCHSPLRTRLPPHSPPTPASRSHEAHAAPSQRHDPHSHASR